MPKNLLIFLLCCFGISALAQKNGVIPYKNDARISSVSGTPKDSLTFFFPYDKFIDTTHLIKAEVNRHGRIYNYESSIGTNGEFESITDAAKHYQIDPRIFKEDVQTHCDSFVLGWFSYILYKMDEPILYNYYLGGEIYRFTWIRSFHRPVVISIKKNKKALCISTKMLARQPDLSKEMDEQTGREIMKNNNIPFAVNKSRRMTLGEFSNFTSILSKNNIFSENYRDEQNGGTDGSEWIFEMQNKNGDYFMYRWSPKPSTLRNIGEFLIKHSSLVNEEVY